MCGFQGTAKCHLRALGQNGLLLRPQLHPQCNHPVALCPHLAENPRTPVCLLEECRVCCPYLYIALWLDKRFSYSFYPFEGQVSQRGCCSLFGYLMIDSSCSKRVRGISHISPLGKIGVLCLPALLALLWQKMPFLLVETSLKQ